ncbi:MAG: 4-hydroxybenzoyl-CoA reductase subunit beta [Betaproteobacteria bacterium]
MPFTLQRPATLHEALQLLSGDARARPVAGGTDLLVNLRHGIGDTPTLVDLGELAELQACTIAADGDEVATLGAGLTLAWIAGDAALARALPLLAEAAKTIAGPAHRTVATLGGNLCLDTRCVYYNQSAWWRSANAHCLKYRGEVCHVAPQGQHCHAAFSGDLAPALLVLGATATVAGPGGARRIALGDLYREDGARPLTLEAGEIVVAVQVPAQPSGARSGYRKARARGAMDFPLAGVAMRLCMDGERVGELRVALTGTNARPFLLEGVDALHGRALDDAALAQLAKLVQKQVTPVRTTVTGADYRRQVAGVLAQRLASDLAGRQ